MQEEKTPHERRAIALRVASTVTAILFVGWLATLGVRFGSGSDAPVAGSGTDTQTASIGNFIKSVPNFLYVATTSSQR